MAPETAITLFTRSEYEHLTRVQSAIGLLTSQLAFTIQGITIERVGAPQPSDVYKSESASTLEKLKTANAAAEGFTEAAKLLLNVQINLLLY